MVFAPGNKIENEDYNTIVDSLNTIYGIGTGSSGYGGHFLLPPLLPTASDLPTKLDGDPIQNEDWLDLRQAFIDTATHQGPALPAPALPSVTDLEGPDEGDGPDKIGLVPTNFFNFGHINHITQLITNKDLSTGEGLPGILDYTPSVRNAPWSTQIEHRFKLTFPTQNDARAFFNTGGEIRVTASRTGGSATLQNTAWTEFLEAFPQPPFIFNSAHYFALTTTFTNIVTILPRTNPRVDISGGPYTTPNPIRWIVQAKSNTIADLLGGRGNVITIRSIFQDQHIGPSDTVNGTFTSAATAAFSSLIFVRTPPDYVLDEIPASPPFPAVPYDLIGS